MFLRFFPSRLLLRFHGSAGAVRRRRRRPATTASIVTEIITAVHRSPVDEFAIDAELADSFPASDPPSWTSGIAETRPPAKLRLDAAFVKTRGTGLWLQLFTSVV